MPDLEPVSKVVKTGDDKEMFVLMSNTNNVFDDEKSRAASFEIIENNGEDFYKSKSIDDWSLVGEKQAFDSQNEGKKVAINEETENDSSETETEDHDDSDDECTGNISSKEVENIKDNSQNDKEKKLSECQSEKIDKVGLNNIIKDTVVI